METEVQLCLPQVDMERFPHFTTDLQFIERLVAEESVHCMPGKCFNYPGYMRLVLTLPLRLLNEALDRIHSFCRCYADNFPPDTSRPLRYV